MKNILSLVLLCCLLMPAAAFSAGETANGGASIGSQEPVVPGTSGPAGLMTKNDLDAFVTSRHTPVVVNFFATWCPPCKMEIPSLVRLEKAYGKKVRFVGLSVDDERSIAKVRPFADKLGIRYPVFKAGDDLVRTFGVTSIPFTVFYNSKGKVEAAVAGVLEESAMMDLVDSMLRKGGAK